MGVNQMTGTPWHLETLHMNEDDERRHKSRCIHYKKANKYCTKLKTKCPGSAHCDYYKEDPARVRVTPEPERLPYSEPTVRTTAAVTPIKTAPAASQPSIEYDTSIFIVGCHVKHNKYGCGIVKNLEGNYISIEFDNGLNKEMDLEYCVKKSLLTREYTEEEIRIAKEKEEAERKAKEEQRLREIEQQKAAQLAQAAKPPVTSINTPSYNQNGNVAVASYTPVYAVSARPYEYTRPPIANAQQNRPVTKTDNSSFFQTLCWAIWLAVAALISLVAICFSFFVNTPICYVEIILTHLYLVSLFTAINPFTSKASKVRLLRWIANHNLCTLLILTLVWLFLVGYLYCAIGAFNYM